MDKIEESFMVFFCCRLTLLFCYVLPVVLAHIVQFIFFIMKKICIIDFNVIYKYRGIVVRLVVFFFFLIIENQQNKCIRKSTVMRLNTFLLGWYTILTDLTDTGRYCTANGGLASI